MPPIRRNPLSDFFHLINKCMQPCVRARCANIQSDALFIVMVNLYQHRLGRGLGVSVRE